MKFGLRASLSAKGFRANARKARDHIRINHGDGSVNRSPSPELRTALQRLREVRSERPEGERVTESFAAWRERIADALDSLAGVLIYQEDRRRAAAEAAAARAESERIRAELRKLQRHSRFGNPNAETA